MQVQSASENSKQISFWGEHSFLSGSIGGILSGCGIGVVATAVGKAAEGAGYSLPVVCMGEFLLFVGANTILKKVTAQQLWNEKKASLKTAVAAGCCILSALPLTGMLAQKTDTLAMLSLMSGLVSVGATAFSRQPMMRTVAALGGTVSVFSELFSNQSYLSSVLQILFGGYQASQFFAREVDNDYSKIVSQGGPLALAQILGGKALTEANVTERMKILEWKLQDIQRRKKADFNEDQRVSLKTLISVVPALTAYMKLMCASPEQAECEREEFQTLLMCIMSFVCEKPTAEQAQADLAYLLGVNDLSSRNLPDKVDILLKKFDGIGTECLSFVPQEHDEFAKMLSATRKQLSDLKEHPDSFVQLCQDPEFQIWVTQTAFDLRAEAATRSIRV